MDRLESLMTITHYEVVVGEYGTYHTYAECGTAEEAERIAASLEGYDDVTIVTISKRKELGILNTSILTSTGTFQLEDISLEESKEILEYLGKGCAFTSAVGHQATAEILSTLLEVEVPVNRIQYEQGLEDVALVFKLLGRAPEGVILTREEVEAIGYKFQLLTRIK